MYYRNTVKGNSNKWEQSHSQTHRHTATTNNRNGVEKIEVIKTREIVKNICIRVINCQMDKIRDLIYPPPWFDTS